MSKVYFMCWKDNPKKPTYSVFARKKLGLAHELIPILDGKKDFNGEFYFKKITVGKNGLLYEESEELASVWQDYTPNEFAWPIVSEKFRNILMDNTSEIDGIDFIKIFVAHFNETKPYYILRFNKLNDVIDVANTLYVKDTNHIIRPCFKEAAFDNIQIATEPRDHNLWKITSGIFISEKLKKALIRNKIESIEFTKRKSI